MIFYIDLYERSILNWFKLIQLLLPCLIQGGCTLAFPALFCQYLWQLTSLALTLKEAGGGPKVPTGQEIVCHFSQGHAMVTKSLDFIHKHPN